MKNKIIKLVEKQGFIIFLFVCVCVVAGGTLYLSVKNLNTAEQKIRDGKIEVVESENVEQQSNSDSMVVKDLEDIQLGIETLDEDTSMVEESELKEGQEQILGESEPEVQEETSEDIIPQKTEVATTQEKVEETKDLSKEQEITAQGEAGEDVVSVIAENGEELLEDNEAEFVEQTRNLVMPVDGNIITEYTHDTLVYSSTLDAFVGHGAIDIEAVEGTNIIAPLAGTIKDVYKDDLYGIVIVIDHGNGLETKYANLQTSDMVKKGIKVEKGDHISKIGKSARLEMHLKPHLHFEVKKDGKLIDPRSIIK